jgi:hypothetical protein
MIILIIAVSAIMAGATFCALAKPGKNENICKYDNLED